MSARFTFEGLPELIQQFSNLGQIAADASRDTVRRTAEVFVGVVKAETPVGPSRKNKPGGNLLRHVSMSEDAKRSNAVAFTVKNTARHAHLIEDGWDHVGGKHIEGKKIFAKAGQYRDRMMDELSDVLPEKIEAALFR
jgi:hypothetical protein